MPQKSSQFLSSEKPCEPKSLDVALKITGVEKLVVAVNLEAMWGLNERSVNDGGDFCLLWLVIVKSVSETHFSCDTVDRELWLAILSSLLCPETGKNIRIGKQGYVFYLTDFKKWCSDVSFQTSISVSRVVLTLGKLIVLKKLISETFFIGFVKFEIKQWFSAYQDQVSAWFSLARLPTEATRKLFLYHFQKETALSFVFWFLEPVQCLGKTLLYLIFCPVG